MTRWTKPDSRPWNFRRLNVSPKTMSFGPMGVCAYIAGFALPFPWDIPLLVLTLCSLAAVVYSSSTRGARSALLVFAVTVFLVARISSIVISPDPRRSVMLSTPLVPAALLFVVIAEYFRTVRHTQALYLTFSAVTLTLASMVLWAAFRIGSATAHTRVAEVGSPILVEANDVTLFAMTAPVSLALLQQNPRSGIAFLAGASILASVCAISILQSRTAIATMIASLLCATTLMRIRYRFAFGLACALTVLVVSLLTDALVGFPLLQKFSGDWTASGRVSLWRAAWAMFADAPLFGRGAHTFVLFYQSYLTDLGVSIPPRLIPWAHNLYLEVLAEQGIVGLTALSLLLFSGLSAAYTTQRATSREIRLFGAGALGALMGFCLAAAVELSFLRHWVVVMLFVLLGLIAHLSSGHAQIASVVNLEGFPGPSHGRS